MVVVGTIGSDRRSDFTAVGDAVNVAHRLEKLARPGEILVSEAVQRRVRGAFRCASKASASSPAARSPCTSTRVGARRAAPTPARAGWEPARERRSVAAAAGSRSAASCSPACTTPLELGERHYRDGDRLGGPRDLALDRRGQLSTSTRRSGASTAVEDEFQQLVVRYQQRAPLLRAQGPPRRVDPQLARRDRSSSRPTTETLAHVQELSRAARDAQGRRAAARSTRAFASRTSRMRRARSLDDAAHARPVRSRLRARRGAQFDEARSAARSRRLLARGRRRLQRRATTARAERRVPGRADARSRERVGAGLPLLHRAPRADEERPRCPPRRRLGERRRAETQPGEAARRPPRARSAPRASTRTRSRPRTRGDPYAAIRHELRALEADPRNDARRSAISRDCARSLEPRGRRS